LEQEEKKLTTSCYWSWTILAALFWFDYA